MSCAAGVEVSGLNVQKVPGTQILMDIADGLHISAPGTASAATGLDLTLAIGGDGAPQRDCRFYK